MLKLVSFFDRQGVIEHFQESEVRQDGGEAEWSRRGFQGEDRPGGLQGGSHTQRQASQFGVHATQISTCKQGLLEGATELFEDRRRKQRVTASHGASTLAVVAPLTTTLHYGELAPNGSLPMRLTFDHRVIDGAFVARVLTEFEEVLRTEILDELRAPRSAA